MRKKPRRRTIYVPSDDTTILTIHPGLRLDKTNYGSLSLLADRDETREASRVGTIQDAKVRGSSQRRQSIAVAPKRIPLQKTLRTLPEDDDIAAMLGSSAGKGNIPPHASRQEVNGVELNAKRLSISGPLNQKALRIQEVAARDKHSATKFRHSTHSEPHFRQKHRRLDAPAPKPLPESKMKRRSSLYCSRTLQRSEFVRSSSTKSPFLLEMTPGTEEERTSVKHVFPLLQENIEHPEMFEDAWLSYQESAVQQLANGLLRTAPEGTSSKAKHEDDIGALLNLYQEPEFLLVYKRLQASLLYGAMCPSRESLPELSRLACDVGLRQKFTAFWLRTYDLSSVATTAQVVIGRSIKGYSNAVNKKDQSFDSRDEERDRA